MFKINSNQIIKKYKQTKILFFLFLFIIIGIMILIAFFVENEIVMTNINILLLVVLLIGSMLFKNVIQGYKDMSEVAKLVLRQSKPIKFKNDLNKARKVVIDENFDLFKSNSEYSIYYKFLEYKTFKIFKVRKLKTIIFIKERKINFYNKKLHDDIHLMESTKVKKYNKHMIAVFKSYSSVTKENINDIGEVVSYKAGRQQFTQINVGLNDEDNKAYFLYSENYSPTKDYLELVNDIKNII